MSFKPLVVSVCLLLLFWLPATGQNKAIELHPLVGHTLDQPKIRKFRLAYLLDFSWNKETEIRLYPYGGDSLRLRATNKSTGRTDHEEVVSKQFLQDLRERVREVKSDLLKRLELMEKILEKEDSLRVWVSTDNGREEWLYLSGMDKSTLYPVEGPPISLQMLSKLKLTDKMEAAYQLNTEAETSQHRYFLTSNGRGMSKGELYYQNSLLTINSLHYGLSKNLSLSAGIEGAALFSTLITSIEQQDYSQFQMYAFTELNSSFQLGPDFRLAGGLVGVGGFGNATQPFFASLYAGGLWGDERLNFSFKAFLPLNYGRRSSFSGPLGNSLARIRTDKSFSLPPFSFAFSKKIRSNIYLITESFYYGLSSETVIEDDAGIIREEETNSQDLLLCSGVRIVRKRFCWDLSFLFKGSSQVIVAPGVSTTNFQLLAFPFVSMSYRIR